MSDIADRADRPAPEPSSRRTPSTCRSAGGSGTPTSTAARRCWSLLAFVCALVIGAILIVVSDEPTRTAMGYFTQHPERHVQPRLARDLARLRRSCSRARSSTPTRCTPTAASPSWTRSRTRSTNATPLILAGLSVGLAFRAGLFNIGGQGQIIAGAICAGYVGFAWSLPPGLHVIVAVLAGALGGAVWGGIAGLLKARTGAHEVITTIMLNYVAFYLLGYLLGVERLPEAALERGASRARCTRRRCCRTCSARTRSCASTSACSSRSPPRWSAGGC